MQILENIQTLSDFMTKETYLILENRFRNKPRPIRRTVYKVSTDIVKYNNFRLPCLGNETVIAFYDEGNDIKPIMFVSDNFYTLYHTRSLWKTIQEDCKMAYDLNHIQLIDF